MVHVPRQQFRDPVTLQRGREMPRQLVRRKVEQFQKHRRKLDVRPHVRPGRQQHVVPLQHGSDLGVFRRADLAEPLQDGVLRQLTVRDPLVQLLMHADVKQQAPVFPENLASGPLFQDFLLRPLDQQNDFGQPPRRLQFQLESAHAIEQPILRQEVCSAVRNVEPQRTDPPVQPDHAAQQPGRDQQDRRVHAHKRSFKFFERKSLRRGRQCRHASCPARRIRLSVASLKSKMQSMFVRDLSQVHRNAAVRGVTVVTQKTEIPAGVAWFSVFRNIIAAMRIGEPGLRLSTATGFRYTV